MYGNTPLVSVDAGPLPGVPLQQPQNLFRFGEISPAQCWHAVRAA